MKDHPETPARRPLLIAIAILAVVAVLASIWWLSPAPTEQEIEVAAEEAPAALPEVPAFDKLGFAEALDAIREHAQQSYEDRQQAPQDADSNGRLGMVLSTYERHAASEILFSRAHTLAPDDFRWVFYLAIAVIKSGDNQTAIELLREALQLDPDYTGAKIQLAGLLLQQNELRESIAMFRDVTRSDPDRFDGWLGLGKALHRRGDLDGARDALVKARDMAPLYGEVHYVLASVLREMGETGQAAEALTSYQQTRKNITPTDDPLLRDIFWLHAGDDRHMLKADAYSRQGQFAEAAGSYQAAVDVNPQNQNAWGGLVQMLAVLGRYAEADARYQDALDAGIVYRRLHQAYGDALMKQQRLDEARAVIEQALALDPDYAAALISMGRLDLRSGDGTSAVERFRHALRVKPNDRSVMLLLGRALNQAGRYDEAIAELEPQIRDPETDRSFAYLELAKALLGQEKREEAIAALRGSREAAMQASDMNRVKAIDGFIEELQAGNAE